MSKLGHQWLSYLSNVTSFVSEWNQEFNTFFIMSQLCSLPLNLFNKPTNVIAHFLSMPGIVLISEQGYREERYGIESSGHTLRQQTNCIPNFHLLEPGDSQGNKRFVFDTQSRFT